MTCDHIDNYENYDTPDDMNDIVQNLNDRIEALETQNKLLRRTVTVLSERIEDLHLALGQLRNMTKWPYNKAVKFCEREEYKTEQAIEALQAFR